MKLLILSLRSWVEVKDPRRRTLRARMENQSSIWLSQEACLGVKWKRMRCETSRRKVSRLARFQDTVLLFPPQVLGDPAAAGDNPDHTLGQVDVQIVRLDLPLKGGCG